MKLRPEEITSILKERIERFDVERAESLGVPFGPERGALQRGDAVELAGGRVVTPEDVLGPARSLEVNAYHHQGVLASDLAPGLRPAAWADSSAGPLVEGLEGRGERFVVGVQCHPERTESTPEEFVRLFAAFVGAAVEHRDLAVTGTTRARR